MAHRCDPYQNTIETERNHAGGGGGGGGYTGRRVNETMPVIHAEVLLSATPLDLESVLFFLWRSGNGGFWFPVQPADRGGAGEFFMNS